MKKLSVLLLVLSVFSCTEDISPIVAEKTINEDVNTDHYCGFVNFKTQADYPGGMRAWNDYLREHMHYPPSQHAFEGAVYLSFFVDLDGTLSDIQVIRGIQKSIDKEAIRLLTNSKRWAPAQLYGEDVKSRMQIRIIFRADRS